MTVSVATSPTLILPGRPVDVTCAATIGNWVRIVLTAAPEGSEWQKKIHDEDRTELPLWAADVGVAHRITFDVPGVYTCTAREYTKGGVGFGGDHLDDPDSYPSETAIGSNAVTFTVGQKMTAEVRLPPAESGTLSLYVWDSTIRATTVPIHGERTPRFDGATPKMKTAEGSTAMAAALTALDGSTCTAAAGALDVVGDDLMTQFNAHIAGTGSVHLLTDSDNTIAAAYFGASTPEALRSTIQHFAMKMRCHFTDDAGGGLGVGTAGYHGAGDWDDLPLLAGVSDVLSASLALASLWHSYESHRVNTTVHTAADSTNTSSALPPLYAVYQAAIAAVQSGNPTAPAVDNPGATLLVHRAGLKRA
jgi:hypothetical protein